MKVIRFAIPDDERFMGLYVALAQGRRCFSSRTAAELGISRSEFQGLRNVLLEYGFAIWRNRDRPQMGIGLTSAGVMLMEKIVKESALPSPTD